MEDFWSTIQRRLPGSIPPGIIFLPGEKLSKKGFRWAPRTWLSAHEIDHPDPLSIFNCTTELDDQGLLVRYPGFLLHCEDRKVILGTSHTHEKQRFTFPIDQDLREWYSVEPADTITKEHADKNKKPDVYQILEQSNEKPIELAIILSRSRPREMPPEIGLLVEINSRTQRWREGDRRDDTVYCCRIIHRVRVCRAEPLYSHDWTKLQHTNMNQFGMIQRQDSVLEPSNSSPSILGFPSERDSKICIGEIVESGQFWYVDGFEPETPELPKPKDLPVARKNSNASNSGSGRTWVPSTITTIGKFLSWTLLKNNPRPYQPGSDTQPDSSYKESGTTDDLRRSFKSAKTLDSSSNSTISTHRPPGPPKRSTTGWSWYGGP